MKNSCPNNDCTPDCSRVLESGKEIKLESLLQRVHSFVKLTSGYEVSLWVRLGLVFLDGPGWVTEQSSTYGLSSSHRQGQVYVYGKNEGPMDTEEVCRLPET